MDSWTLQGDSYSFLRSAPRTFSLCHRDGTPNHVEIFDIINVPAQHSSISETTCLCDIFGDEGDSPSLSSSPAVGTFVPPNTDVDGTASGASLVDDLNDSSGSYHTAPGSSEGEEGFDDSPERLQSPPLQNSSLEGCQPECEGVTLEQPDSFEETRPNTDRKSTSPVLAFGTTSPPGEVLNAGERLSSPAHSSLCTPRPREGTSPLSSLSAEERHSPVSSASRQSHSEGDFERLTPVSKDQKNRQSYQSLTPSPIFDSSKRTSLSSIESVNTQSSPDIRLAQNSPQPRSCNFKEHSSASTELLSKDISLDFPETTFQSRETVSSPLHSEINKELSFNSRETSASPELNNRPTSCNTQASSPFSELRGRVSLPDLLSRGSTPSIEETHCSPQPISTHSQAGIDITPISTPENKSTSLSIEAGSTLSSPAPRYTPPSPVILIASSPGIVEISVSPELSNRDPSPGLLSAASPAHSRNPSRSPSPKFRHISTPTGKSTQVSSPVVSYSISPSPEFRRECSPLEHRHTAPSPEIRITTSSPEPQTEIVSSRSPTSSPHITGFSYTVVQPEERVSPAFLHPSRLSTPDLDRTESRSPTHISVSQHSSIAESTGTPRESPQVSEFTSCDLQPEISVSYSPRYQTPSPQTKQQSPSPEPRYQTTSPLLPQSPTLQYQTSPVRSPISQSPKRNSPASPTTEYSPEKSKSSSLTVIPEVDKYLFSAEGKHVSPSIELDSGDKSCHTEIKSNSSPISIGSAILTSPFVAEEKIEILSQQQSIEKEVFLETKQVNIQDKFCLPETTQDLADTCCQKQDSCRSPPVKIVSLSPTILIPNNRSPAISPLQKALSTPPLQELQKKQEFTSVLQASESNKSLKVACTPENSRRNLSNKVSCDTEDSFTSNMAYHSHRRRTPSPPLTRFTPVHIIAPEKPYRHWQNRSRSPSQAEASSLSRNLNTSVTNRESPNVAPVKINDQAHRVRPEEQLEMDREMQLEEERELNRERQRNREMVRGRKKEEQAPAKWEGWQRDASYRGEQVELSFISRNRKGPVSRSAAPPSKETRQGLPTVQSYSEGLFATRQLQQQQTLQRLSSQQDSRGDGPSRQRKPPAHQNKKSTASRPCRSSSSSMGSELDDADHEVKWFTDVAFSSLSSPELDYLDMYNSSHPSSTNISQPSTQGSPAGVNPGWQAYADFKGSTSKLDNDDVPFQQSSPYYSDGLDPSRRYEMGSFECVDVALEREDSKKVRRGVPKREIQLKRKNNAEGKHDESSENSSPAVLQDSPTIETHIRETLVRQHSASAATQECFPGECSLDASKETETKLKLQKSVSLDETSSKTKMATCLIKNVLSKKMQSVDKESGEEAEEDSSALEEISPATESTVPPLKVSPKTVTSTPQSDYGFLSESHPMPDEPIRKDNIKSPRSYGVPPTHRPSSSSSSKSVTFSQSDSEELDYQSRSATSLRSEMRSELKVPLDSKQARTGVRRADGIRNWDEQEGGESANPTAGNTGASSATRASISPARMTNRDQECENTENRKPPQQEDINAYTSKRDAPRSVEKKKASLNVCLTPEAENKPESSPPASCSTEKQEIVESTVNVSIVGEDGNGNNNKVKAPIHKVRDVRQLVKNTYNLSFKTPTVVMASDGKEPILPNFNESGRDIKEETGKEVSQHKQQEETQMRSQERSDKKEKDHVLDRDEEQEIEVKDSQVVTSPTLVQSKAKLHSQPMQIEYKAVCWKDDKNKMATIKTDKKIEKLQASPEKKGEITDIQNDAAEDSGHDEPCQHHPKKAAETQEPLPEMHKMSDKESRPGVVTVDRKPPMLGSLPKVPSKEREVSTAVMLIRDGSSKTKTHTSPAQEEVSSPEKTPGLSRSPGPTTDVNGLEDSGHSVSMLLKEKGYHADIGAVVSNGQNSVRGNGPPRKHVNYLEIPLQTSLLSDGGLSEPQRQRTFSSSSTASGPSLVSENTTTITTITTEPEDNNIKTPTTDTTKEETAPPQADLPKQTLTLPRQKEEKPIDFEAVKRLDPTFPPRSPAIRRFRNQPSEVKPPNKEIQKEESPANATGIHRPQTIEVKSVAKNSQKPVVPPKPSCKFKISELGAMSNEAPRLSATTSAMKPPIDERSQTIVVSSPTIYRKISNESNSNYTRKLAVSTMTSLKPPHGKTTAAAGSSLPNQPTSPPEPEANNDGGQQQQQQQPAASPVTSRYTQRPITLVPASATSAGLTSGTGPMSGQLASQSPEPSTAEAPRQNYHVVNDPNSEPAQPRMTGSLEQAMPAPSNITNQPAAVPTTQAPAYTSQSYSRSLSGERPPRGDDMHFYASDDPPSYDERESFSPLMLPDLTHRRPNRYQPSSRPPPCPCTATCPTHPGLTPPHHHRSPHTLTPPAPPHSPGQGLPFTMPQPPLRPHQFRPDPQPMSYRPISPKSGHLGPNQPPGLYQPPPCPPHQSLMQGCAADRPLQPPQHMDPRRNPVHRSPQQQPPGLAAAAYSDPSHSHSPGLPPMDPQYMCGPQSLGPSYGSEYGGDSASVYSESSYGQTPRRVLLDPETGKYFYIEVPVQPLRKMLYDPETGQYVEVLIPQQAVSHSGLYPPSAAPYPSLHNPNMYAPAPQYMPYTAPPPPPAPPPPVPAPHGQHQPQPPRYTEASAEATIHPSGSGASYRNHTGPRSKPELQSHPQLDQSYLESMYYVPTGMNASPNPTPPEYYHKHPPNLPPTGGKRS